LLFYFYIFVILYRQKITGNLRLEKPLSKAISIIIFAIKIISSQIEPTSQVDFYKQLETKQNQKVKLRPPFFFFDLFFS